MTDLLFDMTALARNRTRARASATPAVFLNEHAARAISERLTEVNRRFTKPAVVSAFAELWSGYLPGFQAVPEADILDLQPGAFDLIIHAMSLHWSNDPVGQMIQCRQALKPDGLFIAVCFGGRTLHQLRTALAEAESRISGGLGPRVAPMAGLRDIGGLLVRAGFALPVADCDNLTVTYGSLTALMHDLRAMGETNAQSARQKGLTGRALFSTAADIYHAEFADADGRLPATFDLIFLTGWAPDASQQKPLLPGSAQVRLADALKMRDAPDMPTTSKPER